MSSIAEDLFRVPLQRMETDAEITTNTPPLTDMDAVLYIAKFVQTDTSWISYRATSQSKGEWYVWNGAVHALVTFDVDEYLATQYSHMFKKWFERLAVPDNQAPKHVVDLWKSRGAAMKTWRKQSGIEALKGRIRAHFRVPSDHFDQNRNWLVMNNGYVLNTADIHAEPMKPHPSRPVTRRLGVSIDLENVSKAERWQEWLDEYLPDPEEQAYLQEAAGAALLGNGDAKNIVHLVGPKNTGKSTYLRVMQSIFGTRTQQGYAGTLPSSALVKSYGGGANFAQSSARGVRFLSLSEPSTDRTDDAFLKNLAGGGEPIITERKGQDAEEWLAECVLFVAANSVVRFDTTDAALAERINIVEFSHVISKVNHNFVQDLVRDEGDSILLWVIAGALRYKRRGYIHIPTSIIERGRSHVVESSLPQRWLQDARQDGVLTVDPEASASTFITVKDGYEMFTAWCAESGEKYTPSRRAWQTDVHKALGAPLGFEKKRSGGYARLFGVVQVSLTERTTQDSENAQFNWSEMSKGWEDEQSA